METFSHFEIFNYAGKRVVEGHKVTPEFAIYVVNEHDRHDAGLLLPRGQPVPGRGPALRLRKLRGPGIVLDISNYLHICNFGPFLKLCLCLASDSDGDYGSWVLRLREGFNQQSIPH